MTVKMGYAMFLNGASAGDTKEGMGYGILWWFLGHLTIMPIW
jgi:hypothetical protein